MQAKKKKKTCEIKKIKFTITIFFVIFCTKENEKFPKGKIRQNV